MKDFGINWLFFAGIGVGLVIVWGYIRRFRFLCFCKEFIRKRLVWYQNLDIPFYYSSYALKQECIRDFFGDYNSWTDRFYVGAISTDNSLKLVPYLKYNLQKSPNDLLMRLLMAHIFWCYGKFEKFRNVWKTVKPRWRMTRYERALYYYLKAQNDFFETDLESASFSCSRALRLYQKLGFVYEEAECYLLLAQIYRVTGIFDVAETMIKEADKRFTLLNINVKKAECKAYTGLIYFGREQYNIAAKYLAKGVSLAKNHKLYRTAADINNWLGLAFYMNKQIRLANRCFFTAFQNARTRACKTYAAEMIARIFYVRNNYPKALKYIQIAIDTSDVEVSLAGHLEKLYLKAEILFAQRQYDSCKKILNKIIKKKLSPTIPFYVANVYTLLGLVFLKENDIRQAKTLFKQAVDLEHGKNRLKGAAVDYNNLAEIAFREGNRDEAEKYLQQALLYAKQVEDEELMTYLKAKLK